MSQFRAVLVGELNPLGSAPEWALYPEPAGCSGARLAEILGMDRDRYLSAFLRLNLCAGRWSLADARERAAEVLVYGGELPLVLLGTRVAAAFGVAPGPFRTHLIEDPRHRRAPRVAIALPHPSGRCRTWNRPGAREEARDLVARLLQETVEPGRRTVR